MVIRSRQATGNIDSVGVIRVQRGSQSLSDNQGGLLLLDFKVDI